MLEKFLRRSAPNSALIAVRFQKLKDDLDKDRRKRDAKLNSRKDVLLRGTDEEVAKYDAEIASEMEQLGRKIADAQYMLPVLKEELRIATEREKKAAIEEHQQSRWSEVEARLAAFDRRLMNEVLPASAMLVSVIREERELAELIREVNRDLPPGKEPFGRPGQALRYSPPPAAAPRRMVTKSRLKESATRSTGPRVPSDFEAYRELEDVPLFDGIQRRPFDPPPLFESMEIPALRQGDPEHRIPQNLKR